MHELGLYIKRWSRNEFACKSWLILISSLLLLSLPQLLHNQCISTPFLPCYFPSLAKSFKVGAADSEGECRQLIHYQSIAKGKESMSSFPSLHLCEHRRYFTHYQRSHGEDLWLFFTVKWNKKTQNKTQQNPLVFPSQYLRIKVPWLFCATVNPIINGRLHSSLSCMCLKKPQQQTTLADRH